MPNSNDRDRTIAKIMELTKAEFHGHSSFQKGDREIPADWNYWPEPVSKSEIRASLGEGYDSQSWRDMGEKDQRAVLFSYLKRDGFTQGEFDKLLDNVVRDKAQKPDEWFKGIEIEPRLLEMRRSDPLELARQRAREASSDKGKDRGPEIG